MKKLLLLFFVAVFTLFASQNQNIADEKRTIAVVNGYKITKKELDRQTNMLMPRSFFHSTVTEKKLKEVEKEALEDLINKRVLIEYAKKRGYKISQNELEKEEKRIKKAFGSQKNFEMGLKKANLTYEEFKKELRNDLLIQKLYEKEVKTDLSEKELKEYYEKNRYKFKLPEKIKLRVIYLRNDPTDPKGREKALKRAKEVMEKLKKGEDFAELARVYSNAMSRIKGGDMGFVHKGMLDEPIEKAAMKLKKGEISDIVETSKGFYIIKLEEISPAIQLKFDDVKKRLKKELKAKYEKQKMDKILKQAKKEAKIVYKAYK
nr:peptidylprolyl isomerase [Nitrosophilus alvini]